MKQFVNNIFSSLIAGIVFISTVGLLAATYDYFCAKTEEIKENKWISQPTRMTVVEHGKVANTTLFTINGIIKNDSNEPYSAVHVIAEIMADSTTVNSCKDYVNHVAPKSNRAFQIVCIDTKNKELPENINYTVKIDGAWQN